MPLPCSATFVTFSKGKISGEPLSPSKAGTSARCPSTAAPRPSCRAAEISWAARRPSGRSIPRFGHRSIRRWVITQVVTHLLWRIEDSSGGHTKARSSKDRSPSGLVSKWDSVPFPPKWGPFSSGFPLCPAHKKAQKTHPISLSHCQPAWLDTFLRERHFGSGGSTCCQSAATSGPILGCLNCASLCQA